MTNKIKKGQGQGSEVGDFKHYGRLIPQELVGICDDHGFLFTEIRWAYNDKTNRTIVLRENDLENVDYESFGTTYDAEIQKLGLTPEGIQIIGFGNYRRYCNIMEKDGTIVPFEDFVVSYDIVHPKTGVIIEHGEKEVQARGAQRAIERVQQLLHSYLRVDNFKAIPKN